MMMASDHIKHYQTAWNAYFNDGQQHWLHALRQQHLNEFIKRGFPCHRDESWKYTSLKQLMDHRFLPAQKKSLQEITIESSKLMDNAYRLVFIDGWFCSDLSTPFLEDSIIITNVASLMKTEPARFEKYIHNKEYQSALTSLNTAYFEEGAFIFIPAGKSINKPIQFLFINSQAADTTMQNVRNIIVVESNARVSIVEEQVALSNILYFENRVTQLFAAEGAMLDYCKLQTHSLNAVAVSQIEINQSKNSHVSLQNYHLGGQLAREEIHCFLNEQGANFDLQALNLSLNKRQHIDLQTYVHHRADNTTSEELIKCVVASQCQAVFNGKIKVAKHIKQAVANLQNKNLLLAKNAIINTKPELEIFSDDVKCKHGATIGQIDKEMLFYLQSRGIARDKAYQLLLFAFVQLNAITRVNEVMVESVLAHLNRYCNEVGDE